MKKNLLICLIGSGLMVQAASATSIEVTTAGREVEVAVEVLLAPVKGYDDNDNVEIVLHGYLPNTCYTLGSYRVDRESGSNRIRVQQFAYLNEEGVCADHDNLQDYQKVANPYTSEINLGRLPIGDYELQFKNLRGSNVVRPLNIKKAPVRTIDSLPYAKVSSVEVADVVSTGQSLQMTFSGSLNSSCIALDERVRVEKQNDVFIVFPLVRRRDVELCTPMLIPYQRVLNLGNVEPGHYLIHVRSMSGKAVNRVVEVVR